MNLGDVNPMKNEPFIESESERDRRMAWWREARFGMFIHWGLYSMLAGEWKGRKSRRYSEWIMFERMIPDYVYSKIARDFNPVDFNAKEWVKIAKNAGMKYLVVTSKHHDGFCLFHSKLTKYNIVDATPFKRDIIAELAEACREGGIRFGIYYSQLDWHHSFIPGFFGLMPNFPKYFEYMKGQLTELLTNYGPVSTLFFDGDWMFQWNRKKGEEIEALCRSLQPDVVINNRVTRRPLLVEFAWTQKFTMNSSGGDYETPEQYVLNNIPSRDWETCMTMNDTWGCNKNDNNWKSGRDLTRMLIDTASKGGNFLLNVGPDGTGKIPEPSVERLKEMGKWLKKNGEAIYGATAGPLQNPRWGRSTAKPGKIFLHVFDAPAGALVVRGLKEKVKKAYLLTDSKKKPLPLEITSNRLRITLPDKGTDPVSNTIVLDI